MPPAWLPELITIDKNFDKACAELYQEFRTSFLNAGLQFRDHPVWMDKAQDADGYEELFWHLITKVDRETGERLVDYPRAQKLPWCPAMITNSHQPEVKVWSYMEGKRKPRVYLWLEEDYYLVILEPVYRTTGPVYFLTTAFDTHGDSTHKQLRRKHAEKLP